MTETTRRHEDAGDPAIADRTSAYAAEMRAARDAAQTLAAAWAADPAAAAAVIRYRAAERAAEEPAPDSCAVLEATRRTYAAYADRHAADAEAVGRFEGAEEAYASALKALERTI